MTIEQEISLFKNMTELMVDTFARKRNDYGQTSTETFQKFGPISMYVRMYDKMGRLENLMVRGNNHCVDERIEDTLLDLANYALITILEMRKVEMERIHDAKEIHSPRC